MLAPPQRGRPLLLPLFLSGCCAQHTEASKQVAWLRSGQAALTQCDVANVQHRPPARVRQGTWPVQMECCLPASAPIPGRPLSWTPNVVDKASKTISMNQTRPGHPTPQRRASSHLLFDLAPHALRIRTPAGQDAGLCFRGAVVQGGGAVRVPGMRWCPGAPFSCTPCAQDMLGIPAAHTQTEGFPRGFAL